MVSSIIFAVHFLFILIVFAWKWQKDGMSNAFINVALILILFAVGWTITGLISQLIMEPEGFGFYFDRDTFSLTLLTIIEYFFYRIYYKETTAGDKEKQ